MKELIFTFGFFVYVCVFFFGCFCVCVIKGREGIQEEGDSNKKRRTHRDWCASSSSSGMHAQHKAKQRFDE